MIKINSEKNTNRGLFLVLVAEVLLKLTVYVLNESDSIIYSSISIPLPIEVYIENFNLYDRILYAMLFTTCLLGLYLLLDVINTIKRKERVFSSPKLRKMIQISGLFLFVYLLYVSIKFDAKTNNRCRCLCNTE